MAEPGVVRDVAARPCCHTLGKGHTKELIRGGLVTFLTIFPVHKLEPRPTERSRSTIILGYIY